MAGSLSGIFAFRVHREDFLYFGIAGDHLDFPERPFLLINKGRCPFTTMAEKQGAEKGSVIDIFYRIG